MHIFSCIESLLINAEYKWDGDPEVRAVEHINACIMTTHFSHSFIFCIVLV